jgi:hypothetical protein
MLVSQVQMLGVKTASVPIVGTALISAIDPCFCVYPVSLTAGRVEMEKV